MSKICMNCKNAIVSSSDEGTNNYVCSYNENITDAESTCNKFEELEVKSNSKKYLQKTLHEVEVNYNDILDVLKYSFKDVEFEVEKDTMIIFFDGDDMDVTSIMVDEDNITISAKVDDLQAIETEIEFNDLKFYDQLKVLRFLIEKMEE